MEIYYRLILPISRNQFYFTFVSTFKFKLFLSKSDNYFLELIQMADLIILSDFKWLFNEFSVILSIVSEYINGLE